MVEKTRGESFNPVRDKQIKHPTKKGKKKKSTKFALHSSPLAWIISLHLVHH